MIYWRTGINELLRRNPLENRAIIPTSGQKSHHALHPELRCRKAFWYGSETKVFRQNKGSWNIETNLVPRVSRLPAPRSRGHKEERSWERGCIERKEKNIGQSRMSNHKLGVVYTFQKRMNRADVAIKQQPSKFCQLEALVARKDCYRGWFPLLLEHLLEEKKQKKKNWLKEVKESFPGFFF